MTRINPFLLKRSLIPIKAGMAFKLNEGKIEVQNLKANVGMPLEIN